MHRSTTLVGVLIFALSLAAGLLTARVAGTRPLVDAVQAGLPDHLPSGSRLALGGTASGPTVDGRAAPRSLPALPTKPLSAPHFPAGSFVEVPLADNHGRGYVMHLPPAPAATTVPRPLVILLHGLSNTWRMADQTGDWAHYADQHGFLVAYGVGVGASWNAGTCCGYAAHVQVDDVDYLVSIAHDAAQRYPVDRSRIYLIGFSAGDMMAERAECARPEVFAAVGGVAGDLLTACHPGRFQVRMVHMHGRTDSAVPYAGGMSGLLHVRFPPADHLLAQTTVAGSPVPAIKVIGMPCAHHWPTLTNACGLDGTALLWQWVSRFDRPQGAQPRADW